jgi:hypothetical protein
MSKEWMIGALGEEASGAGRTSRWRFGGERSGQVPADSTGQPLATVYLATAPARAGP